MQRTDTTSWADSHTDSSSVASIDTSTEGESSSTATVSAPGSFFEPEQVITVSAGEGTNSARTTGTVSTTGSSDTHSEGGSASVGATKTRGIATTKGVAKTTSSQAGGSTSQSVSHGTTRGRGEAFAPIYMNLPTEVWSLEEQIHTKSVALAHVPQGQAWIRAGSDRPRRVVVPYVGGAFVLPERVERVRRELLEKTPYVAAADVVDQEYLAYRAQLLGAAAPLEADADIELTAEPIDVPGEAPETIPVAKLIEWK